MRLALWQGLSPQSDLTQACAEAEAALAAAAALSAGVVVLPEVWLPGYNQDDLGAKALPADAPALRRLQAAAARHGCALVLGYAEAADDGAVHNAALVLGRDGAVLANYRKIQLYGARERAIYQPGEAYAVFDLGGEKAAVLICYDVEFAPHVRALADQGVTLLLVPTANMQPFTHVPLHTVPAMAANHGMTIVYANYAGAEGDLTYTGRSAIIGPHGEVLARAGDGAAFLLADMPPRDPARLSSQAADFRQV